MREFQAKPLPLPLAHLGEGPLWNDIDNSLYWVDIDGCKLHISKPDPWRDIAIGTPGRIGAAAFAKDGRVVAAVENTIRIFDVANGNAGPMETLATVAEVKEGQHRFNDGKCDAAGRFLVGSIADNQEGVLISISADGTYKVLLEGIGCSNGIAFTEDGKTMYYIDTYFQQVAAFDYNLDTSSMTNRRVIIDYTQTMQGYPDGMTIDAKGNLWVAHWDGWRLSCISPQGEVLACVNVEAERVTSATFGGLSHNTLYITSAAPGGGVGSDDAQPHAGGVFMVDVGVGGYPSYRFGK